MVPILPITGLLPLVALVQLREYRLFTKVKGKSFVRSISRL
jgi:hypothetical protein